MLTPHERRSLRNGLFFVAPWFIGLGVFLLYPIGASFYYSLCEYSVLQPAEFIGWGNYLDLFTDEVFWKALYNTLYYAALALPLGLAVSLGLAMLLNTGVRGMTVYRTIFFLPSLVPMVALAVLWLWIFNGQYGVLNYVLSWFGLQGPGWLSDPAWAKPALVLISLWGVGHAVVIYLAGLQDVPQHLYEAAELDGATWWHKVRHVTLPLISPIILFNLIMAIIGTFQYFTVPYVMSPQGQPARSTYFFAMYLYDNAFLYLRMGYACALAWILFLLILALTLVALRLSTRFVHYEGG
ncbi:MAG TPA: sugar ABC transporter permease [Armatimonadetes bacterium]|nr:sugar ABC transporter permease [Armatimonadota bacterium]